ncbi:MAG: serpin family protein [bacterium]
MRNVMRTIFTILSVGMFIFLILGCDRSSNDLDDVNQSDQDVEVDVVQSEKQRITSPVVSQANLDEIVAGNSEFAFNLYQMIRDEEGNIIYSPYSISLALAMAYAGAESNTEQQMADTLVFSLPEENLHPAFNALDLELASRAEVPADSDESGFKLNIANAIWGQKDYSFLAGFLDVLSENYGAGLRVLDFASEPEESRITINNWVSDETEGKIQDLIPQGAISSMTRLVLTNAIYFNAAWAFPFEEENTTTADFSLLDGSMVSADMMNQGKIMSYAAGQDYKAVEMRYSGNELSMLIIVPDEGQFESFESGLDLTKVDSIISQLTTKEVQLSMPKFTFEQSLSLSTILSEMGMSDAFVPSVADFSGINGEYLLYISDVLHKAFIKVDEEGTEAAAATAVVIGVTSIPEYVELTIDRPFIFLIRDIQTKAILFVGRVVNPNS